MPAPQRMTPPAPRIDAATAANDYAGAADVYSATGAADVGSGTPHVGASSGATRERAVGWRTH